MGAMQNMGDKYLNFQRMESSSFGKNISRHKHKGVTWRGLILARSVIEEEKKINK